jgi:hypothetical protein
MGWDAFRDAVAGEIEAIRGEGIPPLPFDPDDPPRKTRLRGRDSDVPSVEAISELAATVQTHGPGIHPAAAAQDPVRAVSAPPGWRATCDPEAAGDTRSSRSRCRWAI